VGRAFALLEEGASRAIPDGYDSLYVHSDAEDTADDDEAAAGGPHRQEYVVNNPAQVLPEYIIHFDFDPADAVLGVAPSATMTLEERRDHFRAKIDEVRGEVSRALAVLGPSLGSRTEEMLSDLTAKYEAALHASTQPEPLLEERRRSIREGLRRITGKLESVRSNSEMVYEEVCKRMQAALERLDTLTKRKTAVLLSEELELRRQLRQIASSESMVPHLQEALQPTAFVEAWEAHQTMRRELISQMSGAGASMIGEALDGVKADLKVVGDVDVVAATDDDTHARGRGVGGSAASAAAAGGAPAASAIASRLFEGSARLSSSTVPAAAATMPVSATWQSFLREEAGVEQADDHSSQPTSALALLDAVAGPSPTRRSAPEAARAKAALDLERANLDIVKERAAELPPAQRSLGEEAVSRQEQAVAAASARYQALAGAGAATGRAAPSGEPRWDTPAPRGQASRARDEPAAASAFSDRHGRREVPETPAPAPAPAPAAFPADTDDEDAAPPVSSRARQARSPARDPHKQMTRAIERHRLSNEADRRRRRSGLDDDTLAALAFPDSAILQGTDAHNVYLCLPFVRPEARDPMTGEPLVGEPIFAPVPPRCSLVYSSRSEASPSFPSFAGALSSVPGATVMVIKANDHVFGAFASQQWRFSGEFHGDVAAFLFSVTRDVRVPYVGRIKGPPQPTDAEFRRSHDSQFQYRQQQWLMNMEKIRQEAAEAGVEFNEAGEIVHDPGTIDLSAFTMPPPRHRPWSRVDAQFSDDGRVSVGLTDLVIDGDLTRCSSEVESTFGIGLRAGSAEALTLLAGAREFAVTEIEVWAVNEPAFDGVPEGDGMQ